MQPMFQEEDMEFIYLAFTPCDGHMGHLVEHRRRRASCWSDDSSGAPGAPKTHEAPGGPGSLVTHDQQSDGSIEQGQALVSSEHYVVKLFVIFFLN